MIAFKVDPELGALLDAMPNKSEFIRAAVEARLGGACPLCRGTGVAPRGAADEFAAVVARHPLVACVVCGQRSPRPCHAPGHCDDTGREADFERFGVFFCASCYEEAAHCARCERPFAPENARQRSCAACRA